MNIDITHLDFSLSRLQVVEALAEILHHDPFRPSPEHPRGNFHVHLYKATKNPVHNNNGRGLLTLPSVGMGEAFLHLYGSSNPSVPLRIGSRVTKFLVSNKRLERDIMDKISLRPFSDNPLEEEKRDHWHKEHDSPALEVKAVQFGWICRDHTFSIECEESCSDRCHITFNPERRQIRIHLRFMADLHLIVISFASINNISTSTNLDREHALVFYLNAPPSYEKEPVSGKRLKLSHLPIPDHERLAPFTSIAIRIVCCSKNDIRQFRKLCRIAHLNRVDEYDYPVDHRDLFALDDMIRIHDQLCQLPWIVAFQMESLLRNMAIDFKEANALYPVVLQTIEDRGEEFVATALRHFGKHANLLFYSEDEVAIDVVELFRQSTHESDHQHTLIPTDGSLYSAFHVDVTPTTMRLGGPFTEQSNRVIRTYDAKHQVCFLRVSFVDEAHLQYRFDHEIDGREFITNRIGPLLYNGLKIAGRRFDFLAYSQSALREHAVW
jgi:RNA-dependent RNA polymerase